MKTQMPDLEEQLRQLIEKYGRDEVRRFVARLAGGKKSSVKKNAVQYVSEMSLPAAHKEKVLNMAQLFDAGRFLPNSGDIKNLMDALGVKMEKPVKARQAAIPTVFRALASCPTERIERIIAQGLFTGPAELGPISDAIKRSDVRRRRETPDQTSPSAQEMDHQKTRDPEG